MTKLEKLYTSDEIAWAEKNAELLESGELREVDTVNLAVFLIEQAQGQRDGAESALEQLLMHLLKWQYQPEMRSRSWRSSILKQRVQINRWLGRENKKGSIRKHLKDCFEKSYQTARKLAAAETDLPLRSFPESPPFSLAQAADEQWLPD